MLAGGVGTDIIGITGTIKDETISGLNRFGDNIPYPSKFGPLKGLLDALGLSFNLAGSTTNIFLAGTAGCDFESFGNSDPSLDFARNESFMIEAAATPIPATLPLFAGDLGFVGYLMRRRKPVGNRLSPSLELITETGETAEARSLFLSSQDE